MANFSLLAKFGVDTKSFENGIKKAEKHVSGFKRSIGTLGATLGSLGGVAGTVGLVAMTKHVFGAAKEIKNLSMLAGENVEDFQRMAHAANTVGISQEKLADILKDVNDKVGDFIQTGGGPMKDFFEQIAPKVGVTAEQFKNLSGRDALQLYVDSLEKANLSQSDMTFYMEAIASDATALLPLLKQSGKEFEKIGGSLKSPMSQEELDRLKEASDAIEALKNKATIFTGGIINDIMGASSHRAKRNEARDQLKGEGAFDGLRGVKGQEQKQMLITERVALNKKLAEEDAKAAKEKEKAERAAAEEMAKIASGKFYEEKTPEEVREEKLASLKERIKEMQLEQLRAQEEGDKKASEALKFRIKLMERSLGLMNKFDISMEEAAALANADLTKEKGKGKGTKKDVEKMIADTRGDFAKGLTGHDLGRAANKAADKGTRFQKMHDGTFQKYVNGSNHLQGRFTEAQMQAGLEKKIEKDPTQETLKRIESILQGKFVNE